MKTTFEHHDRFLVARAHEITIDVGNAGAFKQCLIEAVGGRLRVLIVDLSEVRDIDSSGLGALVAVLKSVRRFGGNLRLCAVQSAPREVMRVTMIDRVLPLHETVEEAMRAETCAALSD